MSTDFEAQAHVGLLSPKARMDTLDRVEDQVWAFDVDGTLIGSIRSDVLRPGAVELLRELAARGATTVIWSAGGAEYARRMAGRHGLDGHAAAFYGKERRGADGTFLIDHFDRSTGRRPSSTTRRPTRRQRSRSWPCRSSSAGTQRTGPSWT